MNAPAVIANQLSILSIIAMFVVTVFIAGAVLRDKEVGIADMLFATPMLKRPHLVQNCDSVRVKRLEDAYTPV